MKTNTTTMSAKPMIAKKDFIIVQNEERYEIKEGDDISELQIPERFYENLTIEGVL